MWPALQRLPILFRRARLRRRPLRAGHDQPVPGLLNWIAFSVGLGCSYNRADELAGDLDSFIAFMHHNSWTLMALASSCVVGGITCPVLKGGRVKNRWMLLPVGLAFVMAPTTAHVPLHDSVWDLQTAGGPIPALLARPTQRPDSKFSRRGEPCIFFLCTPLISTATLSGLRLTTL